jgi:hypothetical protein
VRSGLPALAKAKHSPAKMLRARSTMYCVRCALRETAPAPHFAAAGAFTTAASLAGPDAAPSNRDYLPTVASCEEMFEKVPCAPVHVIASAAGEIGR